MSRWEINVDAEKLVDALPDVEVRIEGHIIRKETGEVIPFVITDKADKVGLTDEEN